MKDKNSVPLPPSAKLMFMSMMQAALTCREQKKDKSFFVNFASEIWETMEMNDEEFLRKTIFEAMMSDIKSYVEDNK